MVYRNVLAKRSEEIEEICGVTFYTRDFYQPCYSNDGNEDYLYVIPQNSADLIFPASWGLVPDFAMERAESYRRQGHTLSIRCDEVYGNPIFSKSVQSRRCLILADGFFVPHSCQDGKQPYFCYIPGGPKVEERQLFCYAGIYTVNEHDDYFVSLLTTAANDFFAAIDNHTKRMPLVLDAGLEQEWLRDLNESRVKDIIRNGFTLESFDAYPVSDNLYKDDFDSNCPEILKPVPALETNPLF